MCRIDAAHVLDRIERRVRFAGCIAHDRHRALVAQHAEQPERAFDELRSAFVAARRVDRPFIVKGPAGERRRKVHLLSPPR